MSIMRRWFVHRDVILSLALVLGLLAGHLAGRTEVLVLPALAVVMTLSTMGVPGSVLRSPRELAAPMLAGLAVNFGLLGLILLGLQTLLITEPAIATGFVIMAAVPPAVAVIPFTDLLGGNRAFSLVATIGCYLGALVITPVVTVSLLGSQVIQPGKVLVILVELIAVPLAVSRLLRRTGWAQRLENLKGPLTNWCFFVVTYTIVGLNRELILGQPALLAPVALIAVVSTFAWGEIIAGAGRLLRIEPPTVTSLVLLGTLKNYGLAGGLALALFDTRTAVPATVSTVFMIVYIIYLGVKGRRRMKNAEPS